MKPGPFGFDSRPALIGAKYAEAMGQGGPFNRRVMIAYWEEAADIADRQVLADLAAEVDLERDVFLAALDDPIYIRQVDHDVYLAQQYGLNGVPAMVFENQYLVSGAQPLPVLRQVVDRLRLMEGDGDA